MRHALASWCAWVLVVSSGLEPRARADLIVGGESTGEVPLDFSVGSSGWDGPGLGGASLTYYFGAMTSDLPTATVKATLVEALGVWAAAADLTFTETSTPGLDDSIDFLFATGDHGDGAPFDSGVLAHAYYPSSSVIGGDVHFNDAFTWEVGDTPGSDGKYDLLWVTVHELGHSLGLGHSTVPGAVMYPSVGADSAFLALSSDDVAGITAIYASASAVPEPGSLALALAAAAAGAWRARGWPRGVSERRGDGAHRGDIHGVVDEFEPSG